MKKIFVFLFFQASFCQTNQNAEQIRSFVFSDKEKKDCFYALNSSLDRQTTKLLIDIDGEYKNLSARLGYFFYNMDVLFITYSNASVLKLKDSDVKLMEKLMLMVCNDLITNQFPCKISIGEKELCFKLLDSNLKTKSQYYLCYFTIKQNEYMDVNKTNKLLAIFNNRIDEVFSDDDPFNRK